MSDWKIISVKRPVMLEHKCRSGVNQEFILVRNNTRCLNCEEPIPEHIVTALILANKGKLGPATYAHTVTFTGLAEAASHKGGAEAFAKALEEAIARGDEDG